MLYDKLKDYSKCGIYPFHMPGHKRNISDKTIPYQIDITEINDFDNLHNAEGCIRSVEDKAAGLYSVNKAFLLVNGSTGGILSAIRAMTDFGDKVIVARNCHKAVYNAIELCGLDAVYIQPDISTDYGIFTSINLNDVEITLKKNSDAKLVILTSPTYEGVVSDIASISKICKKHNVKLFVDEAHGAHFPFSDTFPLEAVRCGADVAVVSLHKTLPSLTQTALLLTNDTVLSEKLRENLSVFESSSPSYVLMSSIEKCLDYVIDNDFAFDKYIFNLSSFYKKAKSLKKIKILYSDTNFKDCYFACDIGKIIISVRNTSINGTQLAQILREKYDIETEMTFTDYVIAMTSVCDTEEGFERLYIALSEIDINCKEKIFDCTDINIINIPIKKFKSFERYKYNQDKIPFQSSEGRVSLEYVWAYPPGIPLIVPGEIISAELINFVNVMKKKQVEVYSIQKNLPEYITVTEI